MSRDPPNRGSDDTGVEYNDKTTQNSARWESITCNQCAPSHATAFNQTQTEKHRQPCIHSDSFSY